jgi:hypothetical protein
MVNNPASEHVQLDHGTGPEGRVVVIVGGVNAGATSGFDVSEWEYLGPAILVDCNANGHSVASANRPNCCVPEAQVRRSHIAAGGHVYQHSSAARVQLARSHRSSRRRHSLEVACVMPHQFVPADVALVASRLARHG